MSGWRTSPRAGGGRPATSGRGQKEEETQTWPRGTTRVLLAKGKTALQRRRAPERALLKRQFSLRVETTVKMSGVKCVTVSWGGQGAACTGGRNKPSKSVGSFGGAWDDVCPAPAPGQSRPQHSTAAMAGNIHRPRFLQSQQLFHRRGQARLQSCNN